MTYDYIIAGAGASGLILARKLSRAEKTVLILEARDRTGGRILTVENPFSCPVEAGPEFIHGNLPVTGRLLKEAGISCLSAEGKQLRFQNGDFQKPQDGFFKGWKKVLRALGKLKQDQTIDVFLQTHFAGEAYAALRESVIGFVQGFDAADAAKASAFALRDEWTSEDGDEQYTVEGGYAQLTDYLETCCRRAGADIRLNTPVSRVNWQRHQVQVHAGQETFTGRQLILTLPLGVWQAEAGSTGTVSFEPGISQQEQALQSMGFGHVIKIQLECYTAFWKNRTAHGKPLDDLRFIFGDTSIPTWWTRYPEAFPLLTGWLGGPEAERLAAADDAGILQRALDSLTQIFQIPEEELKQYVRCHRIYNWQKDPYARGAYSYATLQTTEARALLRSGIEDTVFFAGEAFYEGPEAGTVEAALKSGMEVARQLLKTERIIS